MRLAGQIIPGEQPQRTYLVWLHGFLGSAYDWQATRNAFTRWPQLYLDLPGHGASQGITTQGFAEFFTQLIHTLAARNITRYWLIGYSLGGRLAMYTACQRPAGLEGIIVEGGNPGLADQTSRLQRIEADQRWALRFMSEPLDKVLDAWYRQPVFASLSDTVRAQLIQERAGNQPDALASVLGNLSLGRQPWLGDALAALPVPFHYLCGARDQKFQAIARALGAPSHLIEHAGHNAHRENPAAYCQCVIDILTHYSEEQP
jgi:2-succinyl-6-hydroxy-2,4-cyclohexadiene-1-carboxylate synthase